MRYVSKLIASTVLAVVAAAPEAWAQTYLRVGPPPPRAEVRGPAPGRGFVWQPGYYRWRNGAYVWRGGVWAHPPARHALWVPPHWVHNQRGWYSTAGHWER